MKVDIMLIRFLSLTTTKATHTVINGCIALFKAMYITENYPISAWGGNNQQVTIQRGRHFV